MRNKNDLLFTFYEVIHVSFLVLKAIFSYHKQKRSWFSLLISKVKIFKLVCVVKTYWKNKEGSKHSSNKVLNLKNKDGGTEQRRHVGENVKLHMYQFTWICFVFQHTRSLTIWNVCSVLLFVFTAQNQEKKCLWWGDFFWRHMMHHFLHHVTLIEHYYLSL